MRCYVHWHSPYDRSTGPISCHGNDGLLRVHRLYILYIVTGGMKAKGKGSTMSSNLEDGTVTIFRVGIKGMRSDRGLLEGRE